MSVVPNKETKLFSHLDEEGIKEISQVMPASAMSVR
jgi:hypothetical protein